MKLIGIYKITSPNGRIYIGQSVDIKRRFREYKKLKCKEQPKLYNSFLKYGVDAHKFEVIELCMQKYLNNMERYYQTHYDSVNSGLNLIYIKNEHFNGSHSEETKKKISETLKGRPIKDGTRQAIIKSNKTRVLSPESIEKFRKASTGKKYSAETKAKQSAIRLGTKRSEETKQKMSESSYRRKQVMQFDLDGNYIQTFDYVGAANIYLGKKKSATAICHQIKGDLKTAYGYKWRYKDC